jgi:hypothetical protein
MNDINTAPRDGTWILLEGAFYGGDTSSWRLGRWDEYAHPDYPWQTLDSGYYYLDDDLSLINSWSWYSDGKVSGWLPLPDKNEAREDVLF